MLKIFLVRSGSTEFDEQGRIKGSLDIPLSEAGIEQVSRAAEELSQFDISRIYSSPCRSAIQTAERLSRKGQIKIKTIEKFVNLDHGLWHGKLIEELKATQPKKYRQFADNPAAICPPGGETLQSAQERVASALNKLLKKHKDDQVILVLPDPLATIIHAMLASEDVGDLWKSECQCCRWEVIDVSSSKFEIAS
ncbi:histidine phosphatase family protein [Mariniblastus sp.]|mgnify:CR=1 FL=1|jgi:phosphoserine phosphatase|nr:histidine phosphatase family protein [Mariniblastus sp.]MDB4755952.1 histidine phosphatase family protein [Mariniblastus sp.]